MTNNLELKLNEKDPTVLLANYFLTLEKLENHFNVISPSPVRCALIEIAPNVKYVDKFFIIYSNLRSRFTKEVSEEGHASIIRAAYNLYSQLESQSL